MILGSILVAVVATVLLVALPIFSRMLRTPAACETLIWKGSPGSSSFYVVLMMWNLFIFRHMTARWRVVNSDEAGVLEILSDDIDYTYSRLWHSPQTRTKAVRSYLLIYRDIERLCQEGLAAATQ